jgi:LysR family transcriptional regulator, glycine cleavage system transcriptional activator
MERLPSIQTLRAFEAAARHGSYSDAAVELNVTHGAISHRIRELEVRLGVSLFKRAGRNMMPTREAVTLLAQVRQAMGVLKLAFPEPVKRGSSKLVVGVHPAFATRWLVPRMGDFTSTFPRIPMEVRSTADLGDFLAPGIDIAIRYGAGSWPNAVSERLADEVLFPVCTPEYKERFRIEQPSDLARCTLLRHVWQPWSPWLRASGLTLREPTGGLTLSDSAMLLEAAACNQGVALARALFARDDLESGKLVRLFEIEVPDPNGYFVVWRSGVTLTGSAETFREWLRAKLSARPQVSAVSARRRKSLDGARP